MLTNNSNDISCNNKDVSKHILPTSSNLLGICFVILNFITIWKVGRLEKIVVDKLVGVSMIFFFIASVMSYASMRTKRRADFYEKTADIIFLIGLGSMAIIALIIAFEIL